MNKLKQKIQDGTINIPGIVIKIALIWFIITFLVFPNLNLLARVFVKDGHFTLEAIDKIMKSARAMKSLKNSFVLAIASIITVNISGILVVLFTEYFDICMSSSRVEQSIKIRSWIHGKPFWQRRKWKQS